MIDARTYSGTETSSDHRIVVTRIDVNWSKLYAKKPKLNTERKINTQQLIHDEQSRLKFQQETERKIINLIENNENSISKIH